MEPVAFDTLNDHLIGSASTVKCGGTVDPVGFDTPNDQLMGSASPVKALTTGARDGEDETVADGDTVQQCN